MKGQTELELHPNFSFEDVHFFQNVVYDQYMQPRITMTTCRCGFPIKTSDTVMVHELVASGIVVVGLLLTHRKP